MPHFLVPIFPIYSLNISADDIFIVLVAKYSELWTFIDSNSGKKFRFFCVHHPFEFPQNNLSLSHLCVHKLCMLLINFLQQNVLFPWPNLLCFLLIAHIFHPNLIGDFPSEMKIDFNFYSLFRPFLLLDRSINLLLMKSFSMGNSYRISCFWISCCQTKIFHRIYLINCYFWHSVGRWVSLRIECDFGPKLIEFSSFIRQINPLEQLPNKTYFRAKCYHTRFILSEWFIWFCKVERN